LTLTRRGKVAVAIAGALALVGVGGIALALTGHAPAAIQTVVDKVTGKTDPPPPPPTCPLTGKPAPGGKVPQRPVLAVKVENTPDAYPLVGLQNADVVYEELVEGGITRFMAVYQCKESLKVGPVRSARTTDPQLLVQYDPKPILAYSGAQLAVVNDIKHAGVLGFDETTGGDAFWRDPARVEPHNLFVNTAKLRTKAVKLTAGEGPPRRLFQFDPAVPKGKHVSSVSVPFSFSVAATWQWLPAAGRWERMYQDAPMTLDTGEPITAANVIIQQVVVTNGKLVDVLGNPSPEVTLDGTGKAWILRNGVLIPGKWVRRGVGAVTKFETKSGEIIPLMPGNTWVELLPQGHPPVIKR
jgi:Protein of unknown function (DUF3048) N-terminal domain/Protein of unknown function (DUF3048) C-terminal domain